MVWAIDIDARKGGLSSGVCWQGVLMIRPSYVGVRYQGDNLGLLAIPVSLPPLSVHMISLAL